MGSNSSSCIIRPILEMHFSIPFKNWEISAYSKGGELISCLQKNASSPAFLLGKIFKSNKLYSTSSMMNEKAKVMRELDFQSLVSFTLS